MADFTPYQRGHSRVFLLEGGPRDDHAPVYMGCVAAGGVSQEFGGVENIECPSPDQHNQWEVAGEVQGATGRASTTLTGLYALDIESRLLRNAKKKCRVDVVIVGGDCTDPSSYNSFLKAKHLEGGLIESHATEDEGSLTSNDNAKVNETADVTAREQYEVMPMAFEEQADSLITYTVRDIVVCDNPSCGNCTSESDGCQRIYAIQGDTGISGGGSPTGFGGATMIYTLDQGVDGWNTSVVDSMQANTTARAIACLNDYVVIVSDSGAGAFTSQINYVLKSELDAVGDETWAASTTGFTMITPMDMWSTGRYAYICATQGRIYGTDDPTAGVEVLVAGDVVDPTSGVAITDGMLAIHALTDDFCVAVGENGAIMFTDNRYTWTGLVRPVALGVHLTAVWCMSKTHWRIGTSTGRLYYTVDAGVTWTEKVFPGSGAGYVYDIQFSNDAVGYMAHSTATPRGRILRTHSGGGGTGSGGGWYIMPETGQGSMPLADAFWALAVCKYDVNFVVAGGVADDANDGIIVMGKD